MATPRRWGAFRRAKRNARPDYKHRLAHKAAQAQQASAADTPFVAAVQVRRLADCAETRRTAFQSMAVAVLQRLDQVGHCERHVAEATISLAQQHTLQHMIGEVEATRAALGQMLSASGATMLDQNPPRPAAEGAASSWWFALCEALHTLGDGVSALGAMAAGQPRGSATHALLAIVAPLLERHYQTLFGEAEQWLG